MTQKILLSSLLMLLISLLPSCDTKTQSDAEQKKEVKKEKPPQYDASTWVGKSQVLLNKIKNKENYETILNEYATVSLDDLSAALDTEDKKFAFWVNTYNAFIQHVLNDNPDLYQDRNEFFKKEQVNIAGEMISFDKIEHGIIRSSTMKLSLGYIPKLFPGDYEKKFRTEKRDPRIHFVLNCGAKDCPPVYIYNDKTLDSDFDGVAKQYLEGKSDFDKAKNRVKTTPLFKWFKGDFDGEDGIKAMLRKYDILPTKIEDIELEYIDYDWTLSLGDFGG